MKEFALIGAAGFVAPRHLQAISRVGGDLIAAVDLSDSVGILDHYFPSAQFFTSIERFDRFLEKKRHQDRPLDYVSICSPNHLHDAHVRLALRNHCHAICEKPLVISPWNLDALARVEEEFQKKVYTVQQLRLLPAAKRLRTLHGRRAQKARVRLAYVTRRGPWYQNSWKGDFVRSGGLALNIGVHFFDLLLWIFGKASRFELRQATPTTMRGELELERADVSWLLSVDSAQLPESVRAAGGHAHRSLRIEDEQVDLSPDFSTLHTRVYEEILAGGGCGIEDARPSIELVHRISSSARGSVSHR